MADQPAVQRWLVDLVASMHAGVYATDPSGHLVMINAEGARLLGWDGRDLRGHDMHALVHSRTEDGRPRPAEACPLLAVARTGRAATSDDDTFWRADATPLRVAWSSAPMVSGGAVTGAVVVFHDATQAHQRAVAQQRLEAANARLTLLTRVSEALSVLDVDEALRRLAWLVVGETCDWCVVDILDAEVGLRRAVVAHPELQRYPQARFVGTLPRPTDRSAGGLALAVTRAAQRRMDCTRLGPLDSSDPLDIEQRKLLEELGCAHAMVTPLTARHQVLGAMTWVRMNAQRPFTDADETLAAEIGRRAGLALDNARLFGQQRRVAETLQRTLLTVLPDPQGLQLTARYLPATAGVEVGGDWYDAFVLPDGALTVVIGDIVGHDLAAAARMGQVRNLLRGIAWNRIEPPSGILRHLDDAVLGLTVGALATCLLARVEPEPGGAGQRRLRWSSAGHPPPALVSSDGTVRLLDERSDLMLGVAAGRPRQDHSIVLQPGDTVWFYTDGLIERRDQPFDSGLTRLRHALTALADSPLEMVCDQLLDRLLPAQHPDDVALLAVRVDVPTAS